ncbi:MAG: hypothetical protein RPS47_11525 [Colwellia sp.]|jgi:hypothetical protein
MSIADYPTKMNFYDGLFLQADDFILEQQYNQKMLSLHNQFLHDSFGVADGLLLSLQKNPVKKNEQQSAQYLVKVTAGFAQCQVKPMNKPAYSWGLYLPEDISCNVPDDVGDVFYVALSYREKSGATDQDKGTQPYENIEEPKVEFSKTDIYSDDKSYVLLGKVTTSNEEIDYTQKKFIYDVSHVFAISQALNSTDYDLNLAGTLVVSEKVTIGNTAPITDAVVLKVVGNINTSGTLTTNGAITTNSNLTAAGTIKTTGDLIAQTATISGDTLTVSKGTITAKDINVTGKLTTTDLNFNGEFSINGLLTANQGIDIPAGGLTIKAGDLSLNSGKLSVTGDISANKLSATGNISGKGLTVKGSISGNDLNVAKKITAETATFSSSVTAKNIQVTTGNVTIDNSLQAKEIKTTGSLVVGANVTVTSNLSANTVTATNNTGTGGITADNITAKNTNGTGRISANTIAVTKDITANTISASGELSAKSITVTGQVIADTIRATGLIKAKTLQLSDGFDSSTAVSAQKIISQTSLVSQSAKVERDFYICENWQQNGAQEFVVEPLSEPLQGQSVMYRIVVEGVSDLGIVHSELSGMLIKEKPSKLTATSVKDIGPGAAVTQSLANGNLTVSVAPVNEKQLKQLCFTASIWLFSKDN